jgi:ClpX C4-type zinc finger protein
VWQGSWRGLLVLRDATHRDLQLVAGPGVYICPECIGLCYELLADTQPGLTWRSGERVHGGGVSRGYWPWAAARGGLSCAGVFAGRSRLPLASSAAMKPAAMV